MTAEFHQMQRLLRLLSLLPILLPEFCFLFHSPLPQMPSCHLTQYLPSTLFTRPDEGLPFNTAQPQHRNPDTLWTAQEQGTPPPFTLRLLKVTGLMTDMTSNPGMQAIAAMPIWSQVSCMLHSVYDESAETAAVKLPRPGPQP